MEKQGTEWTSRMAPYVRYGMVAGTVALAKRSVSRWVQWGTLVFFDQALGSSPTPAVDADVTIRAVREADLAALATSFRRDLAELRARLERGDRGYCAFAGGRNATPLHMRWSTVAPTEIPEAGLWLCPRAGEVYVYDAVTHPLFRGRRLSGAVRMVMDNRLIAEGANTKLAYVRGDNHAMHRSLAGAQSPFRRLFKISYLRRTGRAPLVLGHYQPPVYAALEPALFAKAAALG